MKTKEGMLAMGHEELANYAIVLETKASMYEYTFKECERIKKLLAAISNICDTCDTGK